MLRAVGVADVLEADFLAVWLLLLAGRGDVQRGRLQQRLHALGRARRAAQVMQQRVQQQHRRADARRDQREGQHVQRRHPAQMRVQQAEGQHQANTVTGAIIAWAWAMVPTSGRAKAAKARAKPSTASR